MNEQAGTKQLHVGLICFRRSHGSVHAGLSHEDFEEELIKVKKKYKAAEDTDLSAEQLKELVGNYKKVYLAKGEEAVPSRPIRTAKPFHSCGLRLWNSERPISTVKLIKLLV